MAASEWEDARECSDLPPSPFGSKLAGCAGAVWKNGNPAGRICKGDLGSKPWYSKCCKWDTGVNGAKECKPRTAIDDIYDCSAPVMSPNGASFNTGCAGAVWTNGKPSEQYCIGDGGLRPWYSKCCKWDDTKCKRKWATDDYAGDCKTLPVSMNGASMPSGCPGAVWGSGLPSSLYCSGKKQSTDDFLTYPWWNQCCQYDDEEERCIPKDRSDRRLQSVGPPLLTGRTILV
jgi:hypothetical protein